MLERLRVFLCYSSSDKPVVRELYHRLSAEEWIDPWLDEEELFPGMDWSLEIEKAVEASDAILVCVSKDSINKEGFVQREVRLVLDYANYKPEGSLYIFPVRLEDCELPRRLRHLHYADYFPPGGRDRAYERLLVSLRNRAKVLGINAGTAEEPRRVDRSRPKNKESYRANTPSLHSRESSPQTKERYPDRKPGVTIPRDVYDQILEHAEEHFPNMAGGFLFGPTENRVTMVAPFSNSARHPHTRIGFSPKQYLEAERVAERHGLNITGMFYSQDNGAEISEYTREWAQPFFIYLVIGMDTRPPRRKVYKLTEDRQDWIVYDLSIE
jgi:proteasome lid subunit RPN8/RPN11